VRLTPQETKFQRSLLVTITGSSIAQDIYNQISAKSQPEIIEIIEDYETSFCDCVTIRSGGPCYAGLQLFLSAMVHGADMRAV